MRLYGEYGSWFHLLSPPPEYKPEAEEAIAGLLTVMDRAPQRILELGSGGGNLASHFTDYEMTLTDLSPEMIELSKTINPDSRHVVGDMRSIRLDETFDAVVIHDAIIYMLTPEDLRAAFETARAHLSSGGAMIVMPDHVAETFEAEEDCGGSDAPDGRGLRYLEWSYDSDPDDGVAEVVYSCLVREADGSIRSFHDEHKVNNFPRQVWKDAIEAAGFECSHGKDTWRSDVFFGRVK